MAEWIRNNYLMPNRLAANLSIGNNKYEQLKLSKNKRFAEITLSRPNYRIEKKKITTEKPAQVGC